MRALEFYSGIGAFAQAAGRRGIEIVAAFDQSEWANLVYQNNYGHKPVASNLDSLPLNRIPDADLWWLSPPCTPYSRRGEQKDMNDARAQSLLRLIDFMKVKLPETILLENVEGFISSRMAEHYIKSLTECGYTISSISLCSSMFGLPMLRPRFFVIARRAADTLELVPPAVPAISLGTFFASADRAQLKASADTNSALLLAPEQVEKYEAVLNIIDESAGAEEKLICFTSGYFRCRKASGTLLRMNNGAVRFFSPEEILSLLGFSADFTLATSAAPLTQTICYRLVGNSVDVRAINLLLDNLAYGAG